MKLVDPGTVLSGRFSFVALKHRAHFYLYLLLLKCSWACSPFSWLFVLEYLKSSACVLTRARHGMLFEGSCICLRSSSGVCHSKCSCVSVKRTSRWRGVTPAAAQRCACTLENYLTAEKEPNGLFRFASALKFPARGV